METDTCKSPSQLKYEIQKTQIELSSLLKNWELKQQSSSAKLLAFRADIKELDTSLAATEKGYQAYCLMLNPLAALLQEDPDRLKVTLSELQNRHPALALWLAHMLAEAQGLLPATDTAATETSRVLQAREAHKHATEHIQRKTREIYAAMKEEKKNVEAYAIHLTSLIQEKEAQCSHQDKIYGMGL